MRKIFLLSPASTSGLRARQMMSPRSKAQVAEMYRSEEGVPIALAFAFMSALYFRGKITYALHFADPPPTIEGTGIFVIAPGYGLVPPDWRITEARMKVMRKTDVDLRDRRYVKTLRDTSNLVASRLDPDTPVVLLGSVATGKYVDILQPIFGARLRFPAAFAGLGDMSRGGLMLRATRENRELQYTTLDAPRHRGPGGSGKMPTEW